VPRTPLPLDPERETRLIAAAANAFTDVGYELASLNHIIGVAGMSKSSFYHYFPDKQRLHDHVVLTLRERLGAGLQLPDLDRLDAESYREAMTGLFAALANTMTVDVQTRLLVRMFHHPRAARGPSGQFTRLRTDVATWVDHAVGVGRRVGVLRQDVPAALLTDLALGILAVLATWAPDNSTEYEDWPKLATELLLDTLSRARERSPLSR